MSKLWGWLMLLSLALGGSRAQAQDLEGALDDVPLISAALLRSLQGAPPFVANTEIEVTYKADPTPTRAVGLAAWQQSNFRCDLNLSQIRGPLISPQALRAGDRLKLGPVVLLLGVQRKKASLLLTGAKACLESKILVPDPGRGRKTVPLSEEVLAGRRCTKENILLTFGQRKAEMISWKPRDEPKTPSQVRISFDTGTVLVRFRNSRQTKLTPAHFAVPPDHTQYTTLEDLIHSLLWQSVKSGLGRPAAR